MCVCWSVGRLSLEGVNLHFHASFGAFIIINTFEVLINKCMPTVTRDPLSEPGLAKPNQSEFRETPIVYKVCVCVCVCQCHSHSVTSHAIEKPTAQFCNALS